MTKKLIYDLPTRTFHWLFAGLFVTAFIIAKTVDDESPVFTFHMIAGLILGGLVLLRLIWGFIGTPYARFSSFALHPKELVQYVKEILSGSRKLWSGHNPASSWATLTMLTSALMLALTGILMTTGNKETFEDAHEFFSQVFFLTVILHIAGLFFHSLRHHDGMALSMFHGKKEETKGMQEIENGKPYYAIGLVILIGFYSLYLFKNYNSKEMTLIFFGKTLTLGENEE